MSYNEIYASKHIRTKESTDSRFTHDRTRWWCCRPALTWVHCDLWKSNVQYEEIVTVRYENYSILSYNDYFANKIWFNYVLGIEEAELKILLKSEIFMH